MKVMGKINVNEIVLVILVKKGLNFTSKVS